MEKYIQSREKENTKIYVQYVYNLAKGTYHQSEEENKQNRHWFES